MWRETLTTLRRRLAALVHRRRLNRELEEELAFHVAMRAEAARADGLEGADASWAAQKRFGNLLRVKEACRDAWAFVWLERLAQDLAYGVRTLRRAPGFAAVVLLTLVLGVGATTATFGLLDLRPLPVPDPDRLVTFLWSEEVEASWDASFGFGGCDAPPPSRAHCGVPYPLYRELSARAPHFAGIAAFSHPTDLQVRTPGGTQLAPVQVTSGNFPAVLGMTAALGRTLLPTDDQPGAEPAAMLSHRFWRDRLGSDASVVGRSLFLNGAAFTVVGVAGEAFFGLDATQVPALWIPIHAAEHVKQPGGGVLPLLRSEKAQLLAMIGRLRPDATRAEAAAALSPLVLQALESQPEIPLRPQHRPEVALQGAATGVNTLQAGYGPALGLMRALVVLGLVVACANVAHLLLGRASSRRREIAVRLALGASRGRLVAQLLAEGLALSLVGTALGVVVGLWASRAIALALQPGLETSAFAWSGPSLSLIALAAGVMTAFTVAFGLVPAWASRRVAPSRDLHAGGSGARGTVGGRSGRLLVSLQVAVALVMLTGAGLLVRTLVNLTSLDAGFRIEHLLVVKASPAVDPQRPASAAPPAGALRGALAALPGVERVSWSATALLAGWKMQNAVVEGEGAATRTETVDSLEVGPGFFATLEIPLLAGRDVIEADTTPGSQAVWVNRAFVTRFLADRDPLGAPLRLAGQPVRSAVVAGIVADARYDGIRAAPQPTMYVPSGTAARVFLLRTATAPLALADPVRTALAAASPEELLVEIQEQSAYVTSAASEERLLVGGSLGLSTLVIALAALGVYGVLSYSVARRTGEIAVRMSLGARRTDVLRLVLREGLGLLVAGLAIGTVAAYWATTALTRFLFAVAPRDPVSYVAALALLTAVAGIAAYLPARRAASVDPLVALRSE
ncbi:MAG: ADOP family duplicated permease [Vicinamibacteria bacterium]